MQLTPSPTIGLVLLEAASWTTEGRSSAVRGDFLVVGEVFRATINSCPVVTSSAAEGWFQEFGIPCGSKLVPKKKQKKNTDSTAESASITGDHS